MKKLSLLLISGMVFGITQAQVTTSPESANGSKAAVAAQPAQPQPDVLELKETEHDFGKIPQGKPVSHVFKVKNLGTDSLSLENVQASCGCTTPTWSKAPIAPGSTADITVGYNAAAAGSFEKYITIFYNKGKTKLYKIKGEVFATPAQPAPSNKGVSELKN